MEEGGSSPTSALQLNIVETSPQIAKSLNKKWHSRLPVFNGNANLYYAAIYKGIYYAVAIWSNPVARLLPQKTWLELRRLAIAPDAPKYTASRMIAVMTRLIKLKMPQVITLISYQDTEVHKGVIYKAAGWHIGRITKSNEIRWGVLNKDGSGRRRNPIVTKADKVRWQCKIAANHCSQEVMELKI